MRPRLLKKSNLKTTIVTLSMHLDGFAKIALTSANVRSMGLPPCDGWIVVKSLAAAVEATRQIGWDLKDSMLTVVYPNYTETYRICEWKNLPRLDLVTSLTDHAVDRGFWVVQLEQKNSPFTPEQVAKALKGEFPN